VDEDSKLQDRSIVDFRFLLRSASKDRLVASNTTFLDDHVISSISEDSQHAVVPQAGKYLSIWMLWKKWLENDSCYVWS
jgi:hypothetical protein